MRWVETVVTQSQIENRKSKMKIGPKLSSGCGEPMTDLGGFSCSSWAIWRGEDLYNILSGAAGPLQAIQRALHPASPHSQNMRINHRRRNVLMPQQLLHRPNIRSSLQRMRRETVPERVAARSLR
jgi:hypothetical protein